MNRNQTIENMNITGTHIHYYQICHRKLWLFAHNIYMEQNSDLVYEGRLIHEHSYGRRSDKYTELEMDGIKIDYYDARNKVIHEVKKSNKKEKVHEWQLKYYILVLKRHGIEGVIGILEYPKLRITEDVLLSSCDELELEAMEKQIVSIVQSEQAPPKLKPSKCRNCAYFEFCYIDGVE